MSLDSAGPQAHFACGACLRRLDYYLFRCENLKDSRRQGTFALSGLVPVRWLLLISYSFWLRGPPVGDGLEEVRI